MYSFGHTRDKRRVNESMTRGQQAFILVCDVSFMNKEKYLWAEYIEEHESTIVEDTDLEDYLIGEGVNTQKKRQAEVVLHQHGYFDDGWHTKKITACSMDKEVRDLICLIPWSQDTEMRSCRDRFDTCGRIAANVWVPSRVNTCAPTVELRFVAICLKPWRG